MAEGKKQRKFGRNGRSNSAKLQVSRTFANKAKRRKASALTTCKWMEVPRGATRALRRAMKFWGKLPSEKVERVPYVYAESVIGVANTKKLSALYD